MRFLFVISEECAVFLADSTGVSTRKLTPFYFKTHTQTHSHTHQWDTNATLPAHTLALPSACDTLASFSTFQPGENARHRTTWTLHPHC